MSQSVTPSIKLKSFSCPHCSAHAAQIWYGTWARSIEKNGTPDIANAYGLSNLRKKITNTNSDVETLSLLTLISQYEKEINGDPVFQRFKHGEISNIVVKNLNLSRCFSCEKISVWVAEKLIFPIFSNSIEPNADLDEEIKADFNEARKIANSSPRGAAALLRLCIQKLCIQLKLPGKNLNDDIAKLVRLGLPERIQKALDVVRVIGNEAVHPGELNLRDDSETAQKLFNLVNIIAHNQISEAKEVDKMFEQIPQLKRQAIEDRDKKQENN